MSKYYCYSIIIAVLLTSCKKSVQVSTIDKDLQQKAEKILLTEVTKSKVDSAIVLVMSVKTGEIKALVKVTKSDSLTYSAKYSETSINTPQEPGSIFIPFSIMASIEQGNVSLEDSVEIGNGVYEVAGQLFRDRNANQGGFGKISIIQSVLLTSNIGTILTVEKAFNYSNKFITQFKNMSIVQKQFNLQNKKELTPDLIANLSIGYGLKMTPLQILTCYNAIANNGRMMKPVFITGQDSVINPRICSDKTIRSTQQMLVKKAGIMMEDIGQKNINKIAGTRGTAVHNINSKIYDFKYCYSYFPSDKPKYSCLVIIYRERNYQDERILLKHITKTINQLADILNKDKNEQQFN